MTYEVVAFRKYTGYDKVWLRVEADSPKDAIDTILASSKGTEEIDYECLGLEGYKWLSSSKWSCYEIPNEGDK